MAALLFAALLFLVGCQGVSAGPNLQQQQYGTLYVPQTLNFGTVAAGSSSTLTLSATNPGPGSVTVSSAAISTQYFSLTAPTLPVTIASGQAATISIAFSPNSSGTFNATLTVTSDATDAQTSVSLSGTGSSVTTPPGQLSVSPSTISVGNVTVGSSGTGSGSLAASSEPVTVTAASSSNSAFTISGLSFPVTIPAGESVPFTVTFIPQSTGSASATLSFTSNAETSPTTGTATGTGTAVVGAGQLSVSGVSVGNVVVGTSGTASGSLTASGAAVTVTADSSNNSAFSISGLSFPVTIPAGQSVPFTVTFTPPSTGSASATLSFASNAQTSPSTGTATGTGTAAPTYTVSLAWDASTSPDIAGYNIYRAVYTSSTSSCGSFSKINLSGLNTSLSYSDTVVVDGTSYCYATTAVNTSNEESAKSNIVSNVQIPAP